MLHKTKHNWIKRMTKGKMNEQIGCVKYDKHLRSEMTIHMEENEDKK